MPSQHTGDGYVALSGTSMATPGAAGVAHLMYQAQPQTLSPFDVRKHNAKDNPDIQTLPLHARERAVRREGPHTRSGLENNVYGHGHVNAQPAVEEAANYYYDLSFFFERLSVKRGQA